MNISSLRWRIAIVVLGFAMAFLGGPPLRAQTTDRILNFQGRLFNAAGAAQTGSFTFTFRIYNVSAGGAALFTEAQTLTVNNGYYNAQIGNLTAGGIPVTAFDDEVDLFLGVMVAPDGEMTPRSRLTASAFAFDTHLLEGQLPAYYLNASNISAGTLPVARGGTNSAAALGNNRIMVSSAGAIVEAGALTSGQLFIGSTGAAPVAASLTGTAGQVTVTNGAGSITLGLDATGTLAGNPAFAANGTGFGTTGFLFEGSAADTNEGLLTVTNPTADRTWTLPDASGTVAVSASGNIALSAAGNLTLTGTLPVANGGTNSAAALSNNRIMVSSAGAITEAAALTNGQLLIGSTGAAPAGAAITGTTNQVTVTNGAGSITVGLDSTATLAGNPALAANGTAFATTGLFFEGSGADASEGLLTVTNPTADRTWTLPDASGTVALTSDIPGGIPAAGTTTDATLRWSGAAWVENTNLRATSAGVLTSLAASNQIVLSSGVNQLTLNGSTSAAARTYVAPDVGAAGTFAMLEGSQTFTGAKTFSSTTATNDTLAVTPAAVGAARFAGLITNADLTASRTYTLPDVSGVLALSSQLPTNPFVQDGNAFGGVATLGTNEGQALAFETNSTERVRILSGGSMQISPTAAGAGNTGEFRFLELAAGGSEYVGFKAPDAIAASRIWTLPSADGTSGQVLSTNGSGLLSWVDAGTGGGSEGSWLVFTRATLASDATSAAKDASVQAEFGTNYVSATALEVAAYYAYVAAPVSDSFCVAGDSNTWLVLEDASVPNPMVLTPDATVADVFVAGISLNAPIRFTRGVLASNSSNAAKDTLIQTTESTTLGAFYRAATALNLAYFFKYCVPPATMKIGFAGTPSAYVVQAGSAGGPVGFVADPPPLPPTDPWPDVYVAAVGNGPGAGGGGGGSGTVTSIGAGAGLTGTSDPLTTTGTFAVGAGSGIGVAADAVALGPLTTDWNQSGAFDIRLGNAASELSILESAGGTFYGSMDVGDLSADRTYTFPDASGTVALTSDIPSGVPANGTTASATLRWSGAAWVENTDLVATGSVVGIGTATPAATTKLEVSTASTTNGDGAITASATGATGTTYGLYGVSDSTAGTGVFGYADAVAGTTYGVMGRTDSNSNNAAGVYGLATGATAATVGVFGQNVSTWGGAIQGTASAASGSTYGVSGLSQSTSGIGVYGEVDAATGATYAIQGVTRSSDSASYAGLFNRTTGTGNADVIAAFQSAGTNQLTIRGDGAVHSAKAAGVYGVAGAAFQAGGADFAEWMESLVTVEQAPPGTVVMIDEASGKVKPADEAYAASVAGIVSDSALVLGNSSASADDVQDREGHLVIGLIGQIKAYVTTEGGAIRAGNLLVTGQTPGTLMKGTPEQIAAHPGCIVGKALEAFDGAGRKRIRILHGVK